MRPLLERLAWEHRVRLPLAALFALAWGALIVTFYAYADTTTQTNFDGHTSSWLPVAAWV